MPSEVRILSCPPFFSHDCKRHSIENDDCGKWLPLQPQDSVIGPDPWLRSHEIDGPFILGDLEVTPLPVTHGKVDTIGFLFSQAGKKRLAYIPDAKTLSDETTEAIRDVEILILDALHDKPHPTHLSISESIEIAQKANAVQTWFTHFSSRVDYKKVEPTLPETIQLSWDGLKIGSTNE